MALPSAEPRYSFYGGKGGVGKTTCAAARAVALAETGVRVLLLSTDPAHSLADALNRPLSATPRRIATSKGALWAVELDAERALRRWLRVRHDALAELALRGTYLDRADVEHLLRLSVPGIDELAALLEIAGAAAGRYDRVVVDTAPTGHTLRLIATPGTFRRLAAVFEEMQARHRALVSALGRRARADPAEDLIAELDREGTALDALLRGRDGRAEFFWVTLAEPMAVAETQDALRQMRGLGIGVREIVVNRLTGSPDRPCSLCDGRRKAESAALRGLPRGRLAPPVRGIAETPAEPRGLTALRRLSGQLRSPPKSLDRLRAELLETGSRARARPPGRRPAAPASWPLPAGLRLLLVAGKGGVGKTTCAAAMALEAVAGQPDRRQLLLSVDPAHSVADVLQMSVGDRPRAVAGTGGRLHARELDAARAFAVRRERYRAAVEALFEPGTAHIHVDLSTDRRALSELLDLAPPGIDELFGLLALTRALGESERGAAPRRRDAFDLVILDTAPTGHALRLLAMPAVLQDWVKALLELLLKYRELTGLGELATELVGLARDLRRLRGLLSDPARTRAMVVTRPAVLPGAETGRLLDRLEGLGISCDRLLVNAVTHGECGRCARAAAAERREVARMAARFRRGGRRRSGGTRTVALAPAVAPPPAGRSALRRWRAQWERFENPT